MKNSDVVIAGIGGRALDILPQCAQSAQKKIMVKTYIYSHIQSHIQTENNKTAKTKTHQTKQMHRGHPRHTTFAPQQDYMVAVRDHLLKVVLK